MRHLVRLVFVVCGLAAGLSACGAAPVAPAAAASAVATVSAMTAVTAAQTVEQPTPYSVHVVNHGWHAGLVLRASDVPAGAWAAKADFPDADYLAAKLHALLEAAAYTDQPSAPEEEAQVPTDEPEQASTAAEEGGPPLEDEPGSVSEAQTLRVYAPAPLPTGDPVQFYEFRSAATLTQHLAIAVEAEGPIPEMVLFRRVARAWGLERTGSRIVERLRNLIPRELQRTNEAGGTFFWPKDAQPATWADFRVCDHNETSRRHTDDVCLEELAGLALHVLKHAGASPRLDIARAVCRLLGMARTPAESEARVSAAVDRLMAVGKASDIEGSVRATR